MLLLPVMCLFKRHIFLWIYFHSLVLPYPPPVTETFANPCNHGRGSPSPTNQPHQSYVVNKLLRYLRWSNLIRRHFRISEEEEATTGGLREEPSSDSTNDLTDSAESCSSDSDREKACPQAVAGSTARASSTAAATAAAAAPAGLNGAHTNGNGYTYSDRGAGAGVVMGNVRALLSRCLVASL